MLCDIEKPIVRPGTGWDNFKKRCLDKFVALYFMQSKAYKMTNELQVKEESESIQKLINGKKHLQSRIEQSKNAIYKNFKGVAPYDAEFKTTEPTDKNDGLFRIVRIIKHFVIKAILFSKHNIMQYFHNPTPNKESY